MGLFDSMTPEQQAYLAMGSSMLRGGYNRPVGFLEAFGNATGEGVKTYQEAARAKEAQRLQKMQVAEYEDSVREKKRSREEQDRQRKFLQGYGDPMAPAGPPVQSGVQSNRFEALSAMADRAQQQGFMQLAEQLRKDADRYKPKFKTENQTVMKDGKPTIMQFGEGGERQAVTDAQPWEKPMPMNLGGTTQLVNPLTNAPIASFNHSMSPDAMLGAQTTMRGQNMTDARARETTALTREGQQSQIVETPNGPIVVNKGSKQAVPVSMNGQPVPGETAMKRTQGANRVLSLLDDAERLLPGSTNSYLGAGVDLAARGVGFGTPGARKTASLKSIEGSLLSEMPRMEGPQSNYDVQNYKQAAGQLGDPTIPTELKQAAISTIREIQQRYAGGQQAVRPSAPRPGETRDGYVFVGGDPGKPTSWKRQ